MVLEEENGLIDNFSELLDNASYQSEFSIFGNEPNDTQLTKKNSTPKKVVQEECKPFLDNKMNFFFDN